ncbi:hypothetical protein DL769_011360 [Monosporascus sp. CRB-8-3]|nr:hypothetical protein DL769_011360 [Monosporascus sp. CRB-8-3]
MALVRDPRIADDEARNDQVVSLHPDMDPDTIRMWVALTGSVAAPFAPWWLGVTSVLLEFVQHRYLMMGASSSFLNSDFRMQEASVFAGRIFERILYYMCSAPDAFLPVVTDMLTGFEAQSRDDLDWAEKGARALIEKGDRDAAKTLLTHYSHTRAAKALEVGKTIADA